jgi:NAD(P)-dependent dehydrogenase (short-subunit alcohol dehydrogenase family)
MGCYRTSNFAPANWLLGTGSAGGEVFTIERNRKALVTGGANGIGFAVVERLLRQGARVAIADADEKRLGAAVARLGQDNALPMWMDVARSEMVQEGIRKAATSFDGLDTLVNCAGVFQLRPVEEISEREWDWMLAINLTGTFLCCKYALPYLKASRRGRIVNVSSDAGKKGWANLAHYSASKFGVLGFTQALALEVGRDGITVNAVCPSSVPGTRMGEKVLHDKVHLWNLPPDQILDAEIKAVPLGRLGTVDDIADAILFLMSENASFITGEALNIDGGRLSG